MANGKNARKTKYNRKTYNSVLLRFRRDGADGVTAEELKIAAARAGMSHNAYILLAIRKLISAEEPVMLSIETDPNGYATIDESLIEDFSVDFETMS